MTMRLNAILASMLAVVGAQLVLLALGIQSFCRGEVGILLISTLASAVALAGAIFLVRSIHPRRNHASD